MNEILVLNGVLDHNFTNVIDMNNVVYENHCITVCDKKFYEKCTNKIEFIQTMNIEHKDDIYILPYYQNRLICKVIYILSYLGYKNICVYDPDFIDTNMYFNMMLSDNSQSAMDLLQVYMYKQFYDCVNHSLINNTCYPLCIPRITHDNVSVSIERSLYDFVFTTQHNCTFIKKFIILCKKINKTCRYILDPMYKQIYYENVNHSFIAQCTYDFYKDGDILPINIIDFNILLDHYDFNSVLYNTIANIDTCNDKIKSFIHFLTRETNKELYNLPPNFDYDTYIRLNPDLRTLPTIRDQIIHFHTQGKNEERPIYDLPHNFDWNAYVYMNNLNFNNKYKAENHYLTFGRENQLLSTSNLPINFSTKIYVKNNRNLHNYTDMDIKKHFLQNNRNNINILPTNFDPQQYLRTNPDLELKGKNNDEITEHFLNYGIFENRDINTNILKYKKKVLLLCHIGNINTFKKMEHYITNAIDSNTFDHHIHVVLNVVDTLQPIDKQYIKFKFPTCEVRINKDFGFDIGGFFLYLKYCKEENITYDYVIKIHTKTDDSERNKLIQPLLGSVNRIKLMFDMLNDNEIGLIGSKECMFYNYDKLSQNNQNHVTQLMNKFKLTISYNRMIQFVGGTVFLIRFSILQNIFSDYNSIIQGLNSIDTFDWNWYVCANRTMLGDLEEINNYDDALKHYNTNKLVHNLSGNLFHALKYNTKSLKLRDAMIEHAYERLFSYGVEDQGYKQIFLPMESYVDKYKIYPLPIIFPQFHQIPENDKFWEKGFTEWTMLNKVTDNYLGEKLFKPHKSLRQYNILDKTYLNWCNENMAKYLIDTVCYYHYWFSKDKKVMYKPIEKMRDEHQPNVNFILSWANETWSSRWDGQESQVLLKQTYGEHADWIIHITYLITFFKKSYYVKINNRPLFFIYRPLDIPYDIFTRMIPVFNAELIKEGFDGLYLVIFYNNTTNISLYDKYVKVDGVCGVMDFNPNYTNVKHFTNYQEVDEDACIFEKDSHGDIVFNEEQYLLYNVDINNAKNGGKIKSGLEHYKNISEVEKRSRIYKSAIANINECYNYIENENRKHEIQLYSTFMGWDNTPRRDILRAGMKPTIFRGYNPRLFKQHLKNMIIKIIKDPNPDINYIILNSWNEWNEQTCLEPSDIHGYKFLEAVKSVFSEYY